MHVSIQLLKEDETVKTTLRKDGWNLESDEKTHVRAKHPDVHQESEARQRLHNLGLLTCRICRIEFRRGIGAGVKIP